MHESGSGILSAGNDVVSNREKVCNTATAEKQNSKVERMRAIAIEIELNVPECKTDFFGLLSDGNSDIRLWRHITCLSI